MQFAMPISEFWRLFVDSVIKFFDRIVFKNSLVDVFPKEPVMAMTVKSFKPSIFFFAFFKMLFLAKTANGWSKSTTSDTINGSQISKIKRQKENIKTSNLDT